MLRKTIVMLMAVLGGIVVSVGLARGFSFLDSGLSGGIPGKARAALRQAQAWHSDARLVMVTVANSGQNQQLVSFYFRSPSNGEGYMVVNGQGMPARIGNANAPFDPSFVDYSEALKVAQKAGMQGDPGGGTLSYMTQNGRSALTWQLGSYRVDAVTGKSLTELDPDYANEYDKMWDAARGFEYLRWKRCADQIITGSYTVHDSAGALARSMYPQNHPDIAIAGPLARFDFTYNAPGTYESYSVLVPLRQLSGNEPGRTIWIPLDDPPHLAYVVASGMTNQNPRAQWGNDAPRLRAALHDAYVGDCHTAR